MALRLDTAVLRGEIDNTTRGNVRGRLWLLGREEQVVLDLHGDAWRDVAGSRLTFVNPHPKAEAASVGLRTKQKGCVGDVTASRKVRTATWDEVKILPSRRPCRAAGVWCNSLYLEWFSEENGRVVIESADYEINVSEWLWEMDEAEEEAQKLTNLHTMRGWLAGIILRPDPNPLEDDDFDDSEESWEESLKQSDRLNDAQMEALEKYGEDGIDDDRIAFVMGWDDMIGRKKLPYCFADDDDENDNEWISENDLMHENNAGDPEGEFIDEDSSDCHPLHKRSHDLILRLLTEFNDVEGAITQTIDGKTLLDSFIRNTMNIGGKLAGALGIRGYRESSNRGYVLAILRRCLNWANEALAALNQLSESEAWQARIELLEELRAELFALRDGMTDLRRELRDKI